MENISIFGYSNHATFDAVLRACYNPLWRRRAPVVAPLRWKAMPDLPMLIRLCEPADAPRRCDGALNPARREYSGVSIPARRG